MTIIGVAALRLKKAARSRCRARSRRRRAAPWPRDAAPVQQVADGHEGRHPVRAFLAAQVDGQLGLFVHPFARRRRLDVAGPDVIAQQPRPLQGDEPGPGELRVSATSGSIRGRLSTATAISGRSSDRVSDIVGALVALRAEALGARSRMLVATSCRPYSRAAVAARTRRPRPGGASPK